MLLDARDLTEGQQLQADVCVVGSGPAGMTVALDLAAAGRGVLLLEGGGLEDSVVQDLYQGAVVGRDYDIVSTRQRKLGGTGHWGGWCRPVQPWVLASRPWASLTGWPISAEGLEPHYAAAHATLELGPVTYSAAHWSASAGLPEIALEGGMRTAVYQLSPPTRFGTVYRDRVASAARLRCFLWANAVEIAVTPDARQVDHIACATPAGKAFAVRARTYVLAVGGLENPRLLLASRGVMAAGVGNDHDLVGRYFMEHPHVWHAGIAVANRSAADMALFVDEMPVPDAPLGPSGTTQPRGVWGVFHTTAHEEERRGMLAFSATLDAGGDALRAEAAAGSSTGTGPLGPVLMRRLARGGEASAYPVLVRSEQAPNPASRVTIRPHDTDALGVPRLALDWRLSDVDRTTIAQGLDAFAASLGAAGLGRLWIDRDRLDDITIGAHHMGTTRMGATPRDGVVDPHCMVHGVEGLYVAGSSVFPTCGFANPTLTIVALAHRLAEHIDSRLS